MRAADFAPLGIGGIAGSTYDVFVGGFGSRARSGGIDVDLGERWAIAGGYHKMFACCQYAHSAVEASLVLGDKLPATAQAGRTSRSGGNPCARIDADRDRSGDRAVGQVLDAARHGGRGGASTGGQSAFIDRQAR